MEGNELLELGFKDTSYTDDEGNSFTEFTIKNDDISISVMGLNFVEICIGNYWQEVLNCKTIEDLKQLVRLFL